MLASGTMGTRYWLAGKKGGDSVCWECGSSWETTWMSVERARKANYFGMLLGFPVGDRLAMSLANVGKLRKRCISAQEQSCWFRNLGDLVNSALAS